MTFTSIPIVSFLKAMVTLSDRNEAIDATTVRTILDDQDDLQNMGVFLIL